jgi:hypothetical protein
MFVALLQGHNLFISSGSYKSGNFEVLKGVLCSSVTHFILSKATSNLADIEASEYCFCLSHCSL